MFRLLSFLVFLLLFCWIGYRIFIRDKNWGGFADKLKITYRKFVGTCKTIRMEKFAQIVQNCIFPLLVVCILIMALSGFIPVIFLGKPMAGYLLMLHFAIAPLFALCIVLLSVVWPYKHCFNKDDWLLLKNIVKRKKADKRDIKKYHTLYQKLSFWFLIVLALPVLFSVLFSMYPIFDNIGLTFLLDLHRYSALLLVLSTIGYFYFFIMDY